MKKILSVILIFVFLFQVHVFADELQSGVFTYEITDGYVTITRCDIEAEGKIQIPSEIDGLPVECIGAGAFGGCRMITSVEIPLSIKIIREYAFSYCDSLEKIEIPDTVEKIYGGAFVHGEGENKYIEVDTHATFRHCANLTEVIMWGDTQIVNGPIFSDCPRLTYVKLPDNIEEGISEYEFLQTEKNGQRSSVFTEYPKYLTLYKDSNDYVKSFAAEKGIPLAENYAGYRASTISDWAKETVKTAWEYKLVPLYLGYNYTQNINREQYCDVLYKMLCKITDIESMEFMPAFNDVYTTTPSILNAVGIVMGKGEYRFAPFELITREEAATLLARCVTYLNMEVAALETEYADSDEISDWARESVDIVTALGIMNGTGENIFSPKTYYTKEQCITTIIRLYDMADETNHFADKVQAIIDSGDIDGFPFVLQDRIDIENATIVSGCKTRTAHNWDVLAVVYKDGSVVNIENLLPASGLFDPYIGEIYIDENDTNILVIEGSTNFAPFTRMFDLNTKQIKQNVD